VHLYSLLPAPPPPLQTSLTPEATIDGRRGTVRAEGWQREGVWQDGKLNGYGCAIQWAEDPDRREVDSAAEIDSGDDENLILLLEGEGQPQEEDRRLDQQTRPLCFLEGTWKDGLLDGKGMKMEEGKGTFLGHFRAGKRHGKGTLVIGSFSYKGRWENDILCLGGTLSVDGNNDTDSTVTHSAEDLLLLLA